MSPAAALAPARTRLERMHAEKDARNRDNVARTESYLELYALARAHGVELPWVLMAHLVSRNAGYLMTDLAGGRATAFFTREALDELFLFLERANFLIFDDAWHHVMLHLLGRTSELDARTPTFMREAWSRYEREANGARVTPALERALVLDLVTNEQNLIERRVVHHPRFERARAMVAFFEDARADGAIVLPLTPARIRVGAFARLEQRIEAGRRIFDEVLASAGERDAIFAWAAATRHTGSRAAYKDGASEATLREGWSVEHVRALWAGVHDAPERDPAWP